MSEINASTSSKHKVRYSFKQQACAPTSMQEGNVDSKLHNNWVESKEALLTPGMTCLVIRNTLT